MKNKSIFILFVSIFSLILILFVACPSDTGSTSSSSSDATSDNSSDSSSSIISSIISSFSSSSTGADAIPPVPGNLGAITTSDITTTSLTLNWTKGTDNSSDVTTLQYRAYYSESNNITTVTDAESNGTPVAAFATNINTINVTGLTHSTLYYFNIVIKDEAGNQTIYAGVSATTSVSADSTAPTPGNSGTITISETKLGSISLAWTAGSDNVTAQANLQYQIYYSESNNIDTVENAEANGTAYESYISNISAANVSDLSQDTTYYLNVIIKDEAGNKASYTTVSDTTLSITLDGDTSDTGYGTALYTDTMGTGHGVYNWGDNAPTIGEVKIARDKNDLYVGIKARTADSSNFESFQILIDVDNNASTGKKNFTPFCNQDFISSIGADYWVYVEPSGWSNDGYIYMKTFTDEDNSSDIRDGEMNTSGDSSDEYGYLNATRTANTDFYFEFKIPMSELTGFDSDSKILVTAAPRYNTPYIHDIAPNTSGTIANDDSGTDTRLTIPSTDSVTGL